MQRKRRFKKLINHETLSETARIYQEKYIDDNSPDIEQNPNVIYPYRNITESILHASETLSTSVECEVQKIHLEVIHDPIKDNLLTEIDRYSRELKKLYLQYNDHKIEL